MSTEDMTCSRIGADENGPWREDCLGKHMSMQWSEVTRVVGYKLDCVDKVNRVLELEHESGHYLEFSDGCAGFDDVVAGISKHLDGLLASWEDSLDSSEPHDPPLVIWERVN